MGIWLKMLKLKISPRATKNSLSLSFRSATVDDNDHLSCRTLILEGWFGEVSWKREHSGNGELAEVVVFPHSFPVCLDLIHVVSYTRQSTKSVILTFHTLPCPS